MGEVAQQEQRYSQLRRGDDPKDKHLKRAAHNLPRGYIAFAGTVPCL